MELGLKGKVAVITGATGHPEGFEYGGQGEEAAKLFVQEGVKVVLTDIKDELGEKLAQEIRDGGGEAIYVHTDVTSIEQIANMVDKALEAFGTIDILVQAAGCHSRAGTDSRFPNIVSSDWDLIMNTHLKGTLLVAQEVARRVFIPERKGKIVNVSSLAAHNGGSAHAYGIAKLGISYLTMGMAKSLGAYGVNVNCVSPGIVLTPIWRDYELKEKSMEELITQLKGRRLIDLDRVGTGRDIANVIVWLCSDPAEYITADDINVSAGQVVY